PFPYYTIDPCLVRIQNFKEFSPQKFSQFSSLDQQPLIPPKYLFTYPFVFSYHTLPPSDTLESPRTPSLRVPYVTPSPSQNAPNPSASRPKDAPAPTIIKLRFCKIQWSCSTVES